MKQLFVFLSLVVTISLQAQLADISFDNNSWTTSPGASVVGDELTIVGDASKYIRVTLTKNIPSTTRDVYFVAEVYLENIQGGPENYKQPKFKTYKEDGSRIIAFNIPEGFDSKWFTTGVLMSRFDKLNTSSIQLEFAIQNATGTMKIRNPQLLDAPPTSSYSFPFTVPTNPISSLDIKTNETHSFENDLLSMNSHFTWSPYSWKDQAIQDVLDTKFPMANARFPAGTVGNFYDWTTDGFYNDTWTFENASRKNAYANGFVFDFPGYAQNCANLNASSTLIFNVIQDDTTKAKQRLQDRVSKLPNVKWIEMGNENYYDGQNYGNVSSIDHYITHTKSLSAALKPGSISTGLAVNIDHDNYASGSWNDKLASESYYDACVMHPYINTNTFMLNAFSAKTIFSSYKTTHERIAKYKNAFGNKSLLFTEWGILSGGTPVNFVQTLGVADMFLAIEKGNEKGVVKQAGIHMFYHSDNHNEATLVYQKNSEIVLTDLGVLYAKLFEVFKNKEVFDASGTSPQLEEGLSSIHSRAVKDGDSIRVYIVNKLPVSSKFELKLDGSLYSGDFKLETFSQPIEGVRTAHSLTSNPWVSTKGSGNIDVPAYSISILSIANPVITSLNPDATDINATVYPNPTTGVVHLTKNASWVLYDSRGILIKKGQSEAIELSELKSGSYIIEYDGVKQLVMKN